uniref:C2H2-type domain-containing protein n=1 Tax=Leptobrachium leishanense TaxID=445787 RepID=A0A8C5PAQ8_9ANUR
MAATHLLPVTWSRVQRYSVTSAPNLVLVSPWRGWEGSKVSRRRRVGHCNMASEGAIIPQLVEGVTQSSPSASCSEPMAGDDTSSKAHTTTSIPCPKELVLDEKTKRELFTDSFCRVCGAVLQFESHRISHYEGKKHAQKVRLYLQNRDLEEDPTNKEKTEQCDAQVDNIFKVDRNRFCSLCNMVFSSKVVAQSHYVGKIHAKRLKQLTGEQLEWTPQNDQAYGAASPDKESGLLEANAEQQSSAENEIDLSDPNKYCKLCCASFNKPLVAQQHYNGKKHARNEARRRMMAEMQESGVESHVNDGNYVCPICSITLTSIEMYQSHMQGNKHQIKENIVANVMKTSKKNYDSFQDELADYIKVQKARGLEPKTQFRQKGDPNDSEFDEEEVEDRPPLRHANSKTSAPYKYFDHHSVPYSPHPGNPGKDGWFPQWEKNYRPQNLSKVTYLNRKNAKKRYHSSSSQDSSDDHGSSSSDDDSSSSSGSSSHRREKKRKRRLRKEGRHRVGIKAKQEEAGKEKQNRKLEEVDPAKDESKREISDMDKSKTRKEKRKREDHSEKDGKKHKKVKKEGDQRTEEEILWDESILGF